jgi:hypothetical protein
MEKRRLTCGGIWFRKFYLQKDKKEKNSTAEESGKSGTA